MDHITNIIQHILILSSFIHLQITSVHSADAVPWHYEERDDGYGPSEWFKIPGAQQCGHSQQSPIEINPDNFLNFNTTCNTPLNWNIDDTTYTFTVSHKGEGGHTLLFKSTDAASNIYLNNSFQFDANSQHATYNLDSFHLHWGPGDQNGSEHVYTGITTTLEIHFVHYSADYGSVGEAVAAWENASLSDDPLTNDMHTLAVVGILFEEVSDDLNETYNEFADAIIREMAEDAGMRSLWRNVTVESQLSLKITDLMDVDDFMNNYYYYQGSLTTPPCTPAVRWHLARNTIKIRDTTMDLFRTETKLWKSPADLDIDADRNFRPTQTNPSCIWTCSDNEQLKWCPDIIEEIDYPDWHYEDDLEDGPSNWKNLEGGELCGHEQQSPILIDPSNFDLDRTCLEPLEWNVDNTVYNWTITHSGEGGHTLYVSNKNSQNNVYLTNLFQYEDNYQHPRYNFYSFHVHWGPGNQNGSEHVFEGYTTTFEVHFVHYSNDYVSVGSAVNAWQNLSESTDDTMNDPHTLAVAGFLFMEVGDNEDYNVKADNIILQMATDAQMDKLWMNSTGAAYLSFAITDLVDIDDFVTNYYHYEGSLTTPPCTPAVRWHLAANPIKIRGSTMDLFRAETRKWSTATGAVDADRNFRPIQTNPSCVWTCGDRWCPDEEGIEFPDWHYEDNYFDGPSNWYKINPLCGHPQQSPILIDPSDFMDTDTCLTPLDWHVDDTVYNWSITHKGESGHTLSIYSAQAKDDVYLNNAFQYDGNSQHEKYKLYGFHFHWGPGNQNGSEHVYKDVTTTFEVHFVHYSADYVSVTSALEAWEVLSLTPTLTDMHTLGVVGFLFEEVADNEEYNVKADAVLRQFATDPQMDELWMNSTGEAFLQFAITDLVDAEDFMQSYYHYEGSLTTPPCTPAVRWHLAQNTIKVRGSTMDLFRTETQKWKTATGAVDANMNFRPVQSNPNCVYTCSTDAWCPGIDYPDWHYEDWLEDGPSNWKNIPGGELCGHEQQSPILIDPSDFNDGDICGAPLNWNVDDTVYNWTITHKGEGGHTISVYSAEAKDDVYLDNSFQYAGNSQHEKYKFYSLHFHWGPGNQNGSEHVFKNVTTTFEAHFVHYSSDYPSLGEALGDWAIQSEAVDGDMHTLGVVGFLFEEVEDDGEYNIAADAILRSFATDSGMDQLWMNATGEAYLKFAITDFVQVSDFQENYYHYEGSLTTPPCTPAVRWHLAKHTVKVRGSTMDLFRLKTKSWKDATGSVDADLNFRPIQSNPSCIYTCDSEFCPDEEDIDYPEWHYEDWLDDGPSNWDKINALCGHAQQSPILINPNDFSDTDTCIEPLDWHVDDTVYNWSVTHKGESGHTLSIYSAAAKDDVYLDNAFQYDGNSQHEKYKLYGFHFHWGPGNQNGSEHVYKGVTTTFEVHFVHYSSDYISIAGALGAWESLSQSLNPSTNDMHTLGVVGFLFEEVSDAEEYNVKADAVLRTFATDPQMDELWMNSTGEAFLQFAITDLVDAEDFMQSYYHYEGSLTTPPCTPAVRWHLAQNTIKVRGSTMDLFRTETQKWKTATGRVDANMNFRPVQSNPNCVYTCSTDAWCPGIDYPDWHYEDWLEDGPSNWANIPGGELCGHEQQSPIQIDPTKFEFQSEFFHVECDELHWNVDDTVYNWTITHKGEGGHTINVYSSAAKDDVYLDNSFIKDEENAQHEKYKFYSLHFHWGPGNQNGSEHVFKGTTTTFEAHFVHYSSDYGALGDALGDWERLSGIEDADMHTLGVVGFLFEEVEDNKAYNVAADAILRALATDAGMDQLWYNATGEAYLQFAITDFVDVEDFQQHYYHYWGSLTTPPCTPAVSWHLAQNTMKVRRTTMDLFRSKTVTWKDSTGSVDANSNFRPVQLNPSCIYASTCQNSIQADAEFCPTEQEIDYPDWHYEDDLDDGPANWYKINALCGHEQQSPILIDHGNFNGLSGADNDCSAPLDWHVDDTVYDWIITHKGEAGHTLSVKNYAAKANVYLTNSYRAEGSDQHEKYKLDGFHFHWGPGTVNGSEHVFEGVTTTFEVHFVHYSSDYLSVGGAVEGWAELVSFEELDMHTLGVVGFLFEEVGDDEAYDTSADDVLYQFANAAVMDNVWNNGTGEAILSFAITDLVDAEGFMNNYYHYWGSLTTPPCTPAVSWHLAQNTIKVRKSTMDSFRSKTKEWNTATGAVDADRNFRPIQSNPSCISTCSSSEDEYCPSEASVEEDEGDRFLPLWIVIGLTAGILIIGGLVYFFYFKDKGKKEESKQTTTDLSRERIPTIDPSELGRRGTFEMTERNAKGKDDDKEASDEIQAIKVEKWDNADYAE